MGQPPRLAGHKLSWKRITAGAGDDHRDGHPVRGAPGSATIRNFRKKIERRKIGLTRSAESPSRAFRLATS
jgi:hypothetical protein